MRLASSGVGGVRWVRLALWYVGVHRVRLVLLHVYSCVSVLWMYCVRLASSGVKGVHLVRLALSYVCSCVGVLWMYYMRLASSGVGGVRRVRLALSYVSGCVSMFVCM